MGGQFRAAAAAGQRVIVGSHIPIHPASSGSITLIWNYNEVIEVIHRWPNVMATFCGHTHCDNYHCDTAGVHRRVFKGIIETEPGLDCHAVVDVHEDAIVVHGFGLKGQVLPIRSSDELNAPPADGRTYDKPTFGDAAMDVMEMLPDMHVSE